LCLAISRTKSPKRRSRVAIPTKNDDPNKKSVSNSRKKNFGSNDTDEKIAVLSKSSTIVNFNGILESQQSSHTSENNIYSLKRPLHKHTYSNIYINDNSSVTPNKIESFDLIDSNKHTSFDTASHHEDSIEEWLIKNSVPISVFHPLVMDEISNSSCDVNRSASSNITATAIHFQNTIPQDVELHPSYEIGIPPLCPDSVNSMMIMSSNSMNEDELFSGGSRASSIVGETMSHFNRANSAYRDDDPLRTDLLPGEILPSIDDAHWAL